jgi:hypothetical protein
MVRSALRCFRGVQGYWLVYIVVRVSESELFVASTEAQHAKEYRGIINGELDDETRTAEARRNPKWGPQGIWIRCGLRGERRGKNKENKKGKP